MSTDSFLFYDIETTGLNPCFDQVLQFAAIRTTRDLKEIERYEYRIKLNPDTIPHPRAMLTTALSMNDMQQGDLEYDVIKTIHKLLNAPNTCSLGYNTLGFDDEFLRFSFYRNLLPPYTHQYAKGCSRADIYPLTMLYHAFKPDLLEWPTRNDRVSLKLEDLNKANNLASGQAHDAMVDVEATLALAKKLAEDTRMWEYALGYFDKNTDSKRFDALPTLVSQGQHHYRSALFLNPVFGHAQNYLAPMLYLGQHQLYRNQALWLRLDQADLSDVIKPKALIPYQLIVRKKMAEAPITLPPEERYMARLPQAIRDQSLANIEWLNQHLDILQDARLLTCQEPYPEIMHCEAQASLYQAGFPSSEDNRLNQRFTEANWNKKETLLDSMGNPLYYSLAVRLLGKAGITLENTHQAIFDEYIEQVWQGSHSNDAKGKPRFTAADCLEAIEECYVNASSSEKTLLDALKDYVSR